MMLQSYEERGTGSYYLIQKTKLNNHPKKSNIALKKKKIPPPKILINAIIH